MLERFLEQQPAVFAGLMSRELRKGEDVNTLTEDLATIEAIVKLMQPVKVAISLLCEEDNPTLSMVAPVLAKLRKHFSAVDGDLHIIAEMKAKFLEDFQKRYQGIQDTLHVASALDPHFKVLSFIDDDKIREQTYLSVLTEALTLHKKMMGLPPKKMKALDQMFSDIIETRPPLKSSRDLAKDEVWKYRNRDPLPLDGNALHWWRDQVDLPILSALAKTYLCIPVTSVPSERVFSTADDIVTAQRSDSEKTMLTS